MPLVEVVGGRQTSKDAIKRALTFYESTGKKTIRMQREVKGHVATVFRRLCGARLSTWWNRGLRRLKMWTQRLLRVRAYAGRCSAPSSIYTCPGGRGGIAHVLEHVGPPMENCWHELGSVTLSEELNGAIARGVAEELRGADLAHLANHRDDLLLALLQLKADADQLTDPRCKSNFRNGPVVVKP
jgi:carnitine 3-dehydrogenase